MPPLIRWCLTPIASRMANWSSKARRFISSAIGLQSIIPCMATAGRMAGRSRTAIGAPPRFPICTSGSAATAAGRFATAHVRGIGLHPFFVRDSDTELACRAKAVWTADAEVLPIERIAVPPQWDFSASRKVAGVVLDNCFDGWDGRTRITWPARRLQLALAASQPFRHLVIYVPPGRDFFCVEPVSHANGLVGLSPLGPGATLAGEIVFHVSHL